MEHRSFKDQLLCACLWLMPLLAYTQSDGIRELEQHVLRSLGPHPDSAQYYYGELQKLSSKESDPDYEKRVGYLEAAILNRLGKNAEALAKIGMADLIATTDKTLASQVKNLLGRIRFDNDDLDASMEAYHAALQLADPSDTMRIAVTYNNLSRVYERLKNYAKAIEALEKSIALHEARGDGLRAASSLLNLGVVYYAQKHYKEAEDRIKRSLTYLRSAEMDDMVSIALETLGNVQRATGRTNEAMGSYKEALAISERILSMDGMASINRNIGELYMSVGRPAEALPYLNTSLAIGEEMASRNYRMDGHYYLSKAQAMLNDHASAMDHLLSYIAIKDSVLTEERNSAVAAWQVRFETAEKERTILEQQVKHELDRTALAEREMQLGFVIVGAALAFVLSLLLWRDRRRARKLADARIDALEKEKHITAIRSILEGEEKERQRIAGELHDGLGILLSAARMRIGTEGDASRAKAGELLEHAATEVRRISHAMMPGSLTKLGLPRALQELADGISGIGLKVAVHAHGFRDRLPQEVETGVYRMVQEALSNALRHGMAANATVEISIENGTHLSLVINDDGAGFEIVTIKGDGIGLDGIRTRATLLNGRATITSVPGKGTTWEIDVPLTIPIET